MKTEEEIRAKFYGLVVQRDCATQGSTAWSMLNQRIIALGWVLDHPKVDEIIMDDDAFKILDCVG
ncbi:MAG: hypothetical protein ACYSWO_08675 [Planctomycetota bacterium]|jgi:hypothetical protein